MSGLANGRGERPLASTPQPASESVSSLLDRVAERGRGLVRGNGHSVAIVNPRFLLQRAERGGNVTTLRSTAARSRGWTWIRSTEVRNAKGAFILNVAALPRPDSPLPFVQIEMVVLAGRLVLFVLDAAGAAAPQDWDHRVRRPEEILETLAASHPEERNVRERSDWERQVITPHAVYWAPNRPEPIDAATDLVDRFCAWVEEAERSVARRRLSVAATRERQERFAGLFRICASEAPSHAFLERVFGRDWSRDYIEQFLYPLPDGAGCER